jgi:hypothetical protein
MDASALTSPRLRRVAGIAAFLLVGCGAAVQLATREPRPMSYVGRVILGSPRLDSDRITVPIKFEGGEWSRNSALVPCGIETAVADRSIFITVATALSAGDAWPSQITVPHLAAGSYSVIYRDPDGSLHEVGSIEVPGMR